MGRFVHDHEWIREVRDVDLSGGLIVVSTEATQLLRRRLLDRQRRHSRIAQADQVAQYWVPGAQHALNLIRPSGVVGPVAKGHLKRADGERSDAEIARRNGFHRREPVSYTHLTLPT